MTERLLGLDDVLEILLENGVKPENLYEEYKKNLSEEGKKAIELEYGEDIVKNQIKEFLERLPKEIKIERKVYDAKEFIELKIPEPKFQVQGLMLEKGITILAGYQSTFKTHTAVHIALCLAAGSKVFNKFECKKSKVLYVNEEMYAGSFQKLLKEMSKGCKLEINQDLFVMNFNNWKIDRPEDNAKFLKVIEKKKIELVIFDTFRECFVSTENSADEITKVLVDYVRPIIEKTGCSFLIILHKGKATIGSENRQAVDLIRGSSMFRNYVDSIILMDRTRLTTRVELTHEKIRTTKEQDKFTIIWDFGNGSIRPNVLSEEEIERVLIDDCKKELIEFTKKEDLEELKTGSNTTIHKRFIESKKYSQGTFYSALKELIEEGKIKKIKKGSYDVIDRRLNDF